MAASPPAASTRVVPVLQAGGGTPSDLASQHSISSFIDPVHTHLMQIFQQVAHGNIMNNAAANTFFKDIQASSTVPTDLLKRDIVTQEDFLSYMGSTLSSALAPPVSHDLSYPISNYYISSSHNTYLSGNQLYGEASTDAYKNVLLRGCRCLEIDVWDGESKSNPTSDDDGPGNSGDNKKSRWNRLKDKAHHKMSHASSDEAPLPPDTTRTTTTPQYHLPEPWKSTMTSQRAEPCVLHGYTLTKAIPFRAVCATIRDYAFTASTLPIIVSLEIHAGLEQQQIMVEIMQSAWKGLLVDITAESNITELPSPDQLRNKILIKVKWTPSGKAGESNHPLEIVASESGDEDNPHQVDPKKKKKASKVLAALSNLGVYTRAYTFKSFSQPESSLPNHIFSLSEQKVIDHVTESPVSASKLFNHNRDYLMRIFPSGMRINSSNVEPTFLWRQGAQMVALNWQSWDRGMMLNEGMFAGEEGWVLKPEGFRGTKSSKAKSAAAAAGGVDTGVPRKVTLDLKIEVFAAQKVPLPENKEHASRFHPYVKFQLHVDSQAPPGGHTAPSSIPDPDDEDDARFKWRSRSAKSTNPDFGGDVLRWANVTGVIEALSFLRLKVQDDRIGRDDLAAWACIRLDRLQSGYRFIHLLDAKGMESSGILLVRITKSLS